MLNQLRALRLEKGLNQGDLARILGETQSWVSKCERGEHRLDVMELRTFCMAMGTPLVEFIQRLENALAG
jgi:transcriptional regulator with XRE-family HTH domain